MKKSLLLLLTFCIQIISLAQHALPYSYNFDQSFDLTEGWQFIRNVEDPLDNSGIITDQPQESFSRPHFWCFGVNYFDENAVQYLRSPWIGSNGIDSVRIAFQCKTSGSREYFRIGYYTQNGIPDTSDFQWCQPDTVQNTTWELYSKKLSPDTKYIIIQYLSNANCLSLDDILIDHVAAHRRWSFEVTTQGYGCVTTSLGGTNFPLCSQNTATMTSCSVLEGEDITFHFIPNLGYHVERVWIDGINQGGISSYTFDSVARHHIIQLEFTLNHYAIQIIHSGDGSGTIAPAPTHDNQLVVPWDTTLTFTFTPHAHSLLYDVIVDGEALGPNTTYTLSNIRDDHQIEAVFTREQFIVQSMASAHGSITPNGISSYPYGEEAVFNIDAEHGYWISSLVIDNDTIAAAQEQSHYTHTFHFMDANHTIRAQFARKRYDLFVNSTAGGEFTIQGGTMITPNHYHVHHGARITLTPIPHTGYYTLTLRDNGTEQPTNQPFTLDSVVTNHTFDLAFTPHTFAITPIFNPSFGTVTPAERTETTYFDTLRFTLSTAECHQLDSVVLDDTHLPILPQYSFTELVGEHELKVYFSETHYRCSLVSNAYGEIIGDTTPRCGSDITYRFLPHDCSQLKAVFVDGINRTSDLQREEEAYTLTLHNIDRDHTLHAEFAPERYAINSTTTGNGRCIATDSLLCTHDFVFTVIPDTCYRTDSLTIDGIGYAIADNRLPAGSTSRGDTLWIPLNEIEQDCNIEVFFTPISLNHNIITTGNGRVVPQFDTLRCGEVATWKIYPDDCYDVGKVYLNNVEVTHNLAVEQGVATLTHNVGEEDLELTVEFKRNIIRLLVEENEHGSVYPIWGSYAYCGDTAYIIVEPDTCYQITALYQNGNLVEPHEASEPYLLLYVLPDVTTDVIITTQFEAYRYPITTHTEGDGEITTPATTVACGDSVSFTIRPHRCASISAIYLNDSTITQYELTDGVATITCYDVREALSVRAIFEPILYTLTADECTNGSIIAPEQYVCGDSVSICLQPHSCYFADSLWIDDELYYAASAPATNTAPLTVTLSLTGDRRLRAHFTRTAPTVQVTCNLPLQITPSDTTLLCSDEIDFQVVADNCYQFDSLRRNGTTYTLSELLQMNAISKINKFYRFHFTAIEEPSLFELFYQLRSYRITLTHNAGGTLTANTGESAHCGETVVFTLTPEECYAVEEVLLNGQSVIDQLVEEDGHYLLTIARCTAAARVEVRFAEIRYRATLTWRTNEDTLLTRNMSLPCGEPFSFSTALNNDCYQLDSIVVNGITVAVDSVIRIDAMREECNITMVMQQLVYQITVANLSGGGSLTPYGRHAVPCGDNFVVSYQPEEGYTMLGWLIDGDTLPPSTTYTFENVHAHHTVSVLIGGAAYHINTTAGANGTITPGEAYLQHGDSLTLAITPDLCYTIDSVWVDQQYVGQPSHYTFYDIETNHALRATFKKITYFLTLNAGQHGYISLSGAPIVECGDSRRLTIVPNDCYQVASLYINGTDSSHMLDSREHPSPITLANIDRDYAVSITFEPIMFSITTESSIGGTVVANEEVVRCGEGIALRVLSDTCYYLDSVLVNGVYVGNDSMLVYDVVEEAMHIEARFQERVLPIWAETTIGGRVLPADTSWVTCDDSLRYSFVADEGYHIAALLVDGEELPAESTYLFAAVRDPHHIAARFERNRYIVTLEIEGDGYVTPGTSTIVEYGDSLTLTFTPDACSTLDSLFRNETFIGDDSTLTLTHIVQDEHIYVKFKKKHFTIATTLSGQGTITPSGTTEVACGENITIEATADEGWHLGALIMDGDTLRETTTYTFTHVTTNHNVEAIFERNRYHLLLTLEGAGSASLPHGTEVAFGDSITLQLYPDDCQAVDSVFLNGTFIGNDTLYLFEEIAGDLEVRVRFTPILYPITLIAQDGGTITPSGNVATACGDSLVIHITPDSCHTIDSVWIDDLFVGNDSLCILRDIREAHRVDVRFTPIRYEITTEVILAGNVVSYNTTQVLCGSDTTLLLPNLHCHRVAYITDNGESMSADSSFTLRNINCNHLIVIHLEEEQFQILAQAEGNGQITPSGSQVVTCGGSITFIFAADEGWFLSQILLDGEEITPISETYTLSHVTENHTVTAIFEQNEYIIYATVSPIHAGNIIPYGATMVRAGEEITYNILPFPDYEIADVVVDGISMGNIHSYTFGNVNDNHTIEAIFAAVGVEDYTENGLQIYSRGDALIVVNRTSSPIQRLCLYDMGGKMIYDRGAIYGSQQIPIKLPTGVYVVRAWINSKVVNYKIVVGKE